MSVTTAMPTVPVVTVTPTAGPPMSEVELKTRVDVLAQNFLDKTGNAGLAIAVARKDAATGAMATDLFTYGVASRETNEPVVQDTIFEIGSITKVFTGILLAQAVLEGTVKLDDSMQVLLPSDIHAPTFEGTPITLLNLATHRSSLPRNAGNVKNAPLNSRYERLPYTESELGQWLNHLQLKALPGTVYRYSNVAFGILGYGLARLAGTSYNDLVVSRIAAPLDMSDTRMTLNDEQWTRMAQGYNRKNLPARFIPDSGILGGGGFLKSTIQDMAKFLVANMQPDTTPIASSITFAQKPEAPGPQPNWFEGLAWEVIRPGAPNERIWKNGGTAGFTSYISFARDGSSGFVVLTNGHEAGMLARELIRLLHQN